MRFLILTCLLLSLLPLSACGKKPSFVDPPVSATAMPDEDKIDSPAAPDTGTGKHVKRQPGDNYPHLYPKPWL